MKRFEELKDLVGAISEGLEDFVINQMDQIIVFAESIMNNF